MKKILLILAALVSCISIDAQVLKLYKNGVLVGKYTSAQADTFVFENGEETGNDLTCAEAAAICLEMEDRATTEEDYTITGYITEVLGPVSRNQQSFWMADTKDGGRVFQAYWANLPEGVAEFKAGSKVKISGKLTRYGSTPEIKNADVEILENAEGDDTGGENTGDDDQNVGTADATLVMANLYDITEGNVEAGTVTADGVTLTFDQNGGNNAPKYYWNATEAFRAVRMYAMNKMTVSASKNIESIKITCAEPYNGTNYNGNETMTTSAGTLTQNSDNISVVVTGINANSVDIVNDHTSTSGGKQLRVISVEIVYAK